MFSLLPFVLPRQLYYDIVLRSKNTKAPPLFFLTFLPAAILRLCLGFNVGWGGGGKWPFDKGRERQRIYMENKHICTSKKDFFACYYLLIC